MREARVAAQTAHQERQAVLDAQRQAAVQEEEQEKLHYRGMDMSIVLQRC